MRLTYHPDAKVELIDALQFYEHRVPGLGQRLLREFEKTVLEIQSDPDRWPTMEGDLRYRLMQSFPYEIYFRIFGDEMRVLVVKHYSRRQNYWRYRLNQ